MTWPSGTRGPLLVASALLVGVAPLAGCDTGGQPGPPPAAAHKRIEIVSTRPHDRSAFTQGLQIHDGALYESTGNYGTSGVSRTPLDGAGAEVSSDLPADQFGEGMTLVPGGEAPERLWQLTWTEGIAYERDPDTLTERRTVRYDGEGWGLCHLASEAADARGELVMSDGSDELIFRDADRFDEEDRVKVTRDGHGVDQLNELECVGTDTVYANVFTTDEILEIDAATGVVRATIDASEATRALPAEVTDDPDAVLNGIAQIPGTDRFWITGKRWPTLYEVRFVPA